jgi:hypothetical protein
MLDEMHWSLRTYQDKDSYTLGRIGAHNVLIAITPEIGNNSAAIVAVQLLNNFTSIKFSAHGKCAEARSTTRRIGNQISKYLSEMMERFPNTEEEYIYPGIEHDYLITLSPPPHGFFKQKSTKVQPQGDNKNPQTQK